MIEMRQARFDSFPAEIFDEYPWNMLLHLFVALSQNETLSEREMLARAGSPISTGRRWLAHLVADGQVLARENGDDVSFAEGAADRMRTFLDRAAIIQERAVQ